MKNAIAIRRETKNKWERRVPLTPLAVESIIKDSYPISVQSSEVRIFPDQDYVKAGATLCDSTNFSDVVLGIKEPPLDTICENQTHLCFSHTIKGQPYNMEMLKAFIDKKCTLIDYEPMIDDEGKRVAAVFSVFAGISGTVETLRVYSQKQKLRNKNTCLEKLKAPLEYQRLAVMRDELRAFSPFNENLRIVVVGGEGNVSKGCMMVLNDLGIERIEPSSVLDNTSSGPWYAVLDIKDIVASRDGSEFNLNNYLALGLGAYESRFEDYLGSFDILLQGAYWDEKYPRQITHETIEKYGDKLPDVIGDISCDIDGAIQTTTRSTSIDNPSYTLNTTTREEVDGVTLSGPTTMAIDNLPCELPADASDEFSKLLSRSISYLSSFDRNKSFEECGLSRELMSGTILYKGEFTPPFKYMERFV
ncbi:MAG TPA: alanine dehydrogenase [Oligoflexia bacterium]|nr:alanine dehydrogenase [Oligoflexia bacterium]HMP47799.1 alanine dehydrogenase [Oligoflexia bacterium]